MWRYELRKRAEQLQMWIVWRLPRSLVYWAAIRVWAHATSGRWGNEVPASVALRTALERWEKVPDNRRVMRDRYPDPS